MAQILFQWDSNPEAEGVDYYQLFEKKPSSTDFFLVVDNIAVTNFSLNMEGLEQGMYEYEVRAVNEFGEGAFSDPLSINFILPSQVTGFHYTIS